MHVTRRDRNEASQKGYRQRLHLFARYCDERGIMLGDIDSRIVDDFLEHIETTHTPRKRGATRISKATLRGISTILKAFLYWAARDRHVYGEFVEESTIRAIKKPKEGYLIVQTFSPSQVRALLFACDQEQNARQAARARAIIHTLIGTGIRASELCHLKLCHLALSDDAPTLLVVAGKGERDRKIRLGPVTRAKLAHWVETWRADVPRSAPVFPGRRGIEAIEVAGLQQLIKRLALRAGIVDMRVSPHVFRHTFSVDYMRRGGTIYGLQHVLGHASLVTSERYLRSLGQDDLADLSAGVMR